MKEEPYCKFILKHDTENYLWQFMKNLIIRFQWNAAHTDLVNMYYLIWTVNVKNLQYKKLFKIQGTGCCNINFTLSCYTYHGVLKRGCSKICEIWILPCFWQVYDVMNCLNKNVIPNFVWYLEVEKGITLKLCRLIGY